MATHSSVLAWRIPGTGQPGGLPSMGSHRVGHDRSDSSSSSNPVLACTGSLVGLMVTSKGLIVNTQLLGLLLPMPLSPQQATCRFTPLQETCKHSQADLTQSLVGSVLLFPVSWYRQALFVPSMNLCFPQSIIKSCWPSKPDSLGIPNPFVRSPGWEV